MKKGKLRMMKFLVKKKNKHEKLKITYDEILSEKKNFAQYQFG